jgi:hypothetical protein
MPTDLPGPTDRMSPAYGFYHRDFAPTKVTGFPADPIAPADLLRQRDELLHVLRAAVRRVEIANAEGDPILSAWLPAARAAIANAEGTPNEPR